MYTLVNFFTGLTLLGGICYFASFDYHDLKSNILEIDVFFFFLNVSCIYVNRVVSGHLYFEVLKITQEYTIQEINF